MGNYFLLLQINRNIYLLKLHGFIFVQSHFCDSINLSQHCAYPIVLQPLSTLVLNYVPRMGDTMKIDIGIAEESRKEIAQGLAHLLADSYTLYLKTHNYHWNVTGSHFKSLHELFEEHYTELATAVDEIAERIRALGELAPGSFKEFLSLTSIKEAQGHPNDMQMVEDLVVAHEQVVKTARQVLPKAADAGDEVTVGLLAARMEVHEKTAWMLRSTL